MNERWRTDVLAAINEFDASSDAPVAAVQAKLQAVLSLWEGSEDEKYRAIDKAENTLEEILHARVLDEQRVEARTCLATLQRELTIRT